MLTSADPHLDQFLISSVGAVAQLYDISCLFDSSPTLFKTIQEPLYEAWTNLSSEVTVQEITAVTPALLSPEIILADHYFILNPSGTGLSPVWDFRATKSFFGNKNAFMLGAGVASVVSPVDPPNNINWLRIRKVSGEIADEVYRIYTMGGQPPASVSFLFLALRVWVGDSCPSPALVHARPDSRYQCQIYRPVLVLWRTTLVNYATPVRNPRSCISRLSQSEAKIGSLPSLFFDTAVFAYHYPSDSTIVRRQNSSERPIAALNPKKTSFELQSIQPSDRFPSLFIPWHPRWAQLL